MNALLSLVVLLVLPTWVSALTHSKLIKPIIISICFSKFLSIKKNKL